MKLKNHISKISIIITIFIVTVCASNINWGKNHWVDAVMVDAKGYYAYLPATFIYHDLNFGFFDKIENQYYKGYLYYDYRKSVGSKMIDKYYCGTAVAELPFFLIAHSLAKSLGFEPDGYSKPYVILINISTIFYLLIGLFFLEKLLSLYNINKWTVAIVLPAIVFGTNMFFYTACKPGLSHVYSFAFVSMFLFFAKKYFLEHQKNNILYLALAYGMIVLIRPVNGIILFALPFLACDLQTLRKGFSHLFENKKNIFLATLIILLILSIQLIIYKIATGSFFIYSYADEHFNFNEFHFIDFLFSYKKGLFLYSPLLFVALLFGLFSLWKQNKFEFYSFLFFFFIVVYILSSWWMWWYGGSFGSRVFIEYFPLFALLLALAIDKISKTYLKNIFVLLIFILVIFCQIQTYQYRYGQIHWENMTYEKYWNVFLRIDKLL
jgi:hypothetical protein